jgi:hypothetical protein
MPTSANIGGVCVERVPGTTGTCTELSTSDTMYAEGCVVTA